MRGLDCLFCSSSAAGQLAQYLIKPLCEGRLGTQMSADPIDEVRKLRIGRDSIAELGDQNAFHENKSSLVLIPLFWKRQPRGKTLLNRLYFARSGDRGNRAWIPRWLATRFRFPGLGGQERAY